MWDRGEVFAGLLENRYWTSRIVSENSGEFWQVLSELSSLARRYFVLIVIGASLTGYYLPEFFGWVGTSVNVAWIGTVNGVVLGLGIIMLGMGMTLSVSEVKKALVHPRRIVLGVLLQFFFMPLIAFGLVVVGGIEPVVALGIILLGCCPGGTASNVMAFLADVDVPLSIAVTLTGTLLAPILTPWLFWFYGEKLLGLYLGSTVDVPIVVLAKAIFVVVVPVILGMVLKTRLGLGRYGQVLDRGFRVLSITIIALIVAYIVSTLDLELTRPRLMVLTVPVVLHNAIGLAAGYWASTWIGFSTGSARTLALEVGMQNSGLAMAIAGLMESSLLPRANFSSPEFALLAVPAIVFSVWHNITGPLLASVWAANAR